MLYIDNASLDPYRNLALEEYLFGQWELDEPVIMLWRDEACVVAGCYQNVFAEVDTVRARELGVRIARRVTGGGTVYHDTGNVNYTMILPGAGALDYEAVMSPVVDALNKMGVPARINRKSDIAIDGKKVSGSAQKISRGRLLHHGTLLYSADLTALRDLANGRRDQFVTKGVASEPWPVTNIADCIPGKTAPVEDFIATLKDHLARGASSFELNDAAQKAVDDLAEKKYRTWDWIYAKSPRFTRYFSLELGGKSVAGRYEAQSGVITDIAFDGEDDTLRELAALLSGAELRFDVIERIFIAAGLAEGAWRAIF